MDYPIIESKKYRKESHSKFMNDFVKNRFFYNTDYKDYFLLGCPIVESIKDIKGNITLLNKLIKKNHIDPNYYLEEIERLNKTLDSFSLKKKENKIIEKSFLKDEEYSNTYILTNESSENLTKIA
jgi:hypothetical protein